MWLWTMMSVGRSCGQEGLVRPRQQPQIVGVANVQDVPAVAHEPSSDVFGEGNVRAALDGDAVAIVDPAEVAQRQMAGQRGRLAADALHHAPIAGQGVHVVVEQLKAGSVEALGEPALGDGHPDACGQALAERARRRLYARGPAILRMTRTSAAQLAKALDVVERHRWLADLLVRGGSRFHAGQVEQAVEQHGGVAGREDEPVAVGPVRAFRIEAKELVPQAVCRWRGVQARARMP
jgi:hypothetical protein